MGGQACVLYGAAEFSRDTDLAILADAANLNRLRNALNDLRAKVIAVDPKYDFVVLDAGGNQGIVEGAKLLVNRDGQLVGKIKITSVEPNRSIGNVLPEWKQAGNEIMEGDLVFF